MALSILCNFHKN